MLNVVKHLCKVITSMQNNLPALATVVSVSAMVVTFFALYVVLTVVTK